MALDPSRLRLWLAARNRSLAPFVQELAPLDLRIVGRTLLHAALVGLGAGLLGGLFFAGLVWAQRLLLEGWAGYVPLRAHGEFGAPGEQVHPFRPWLLAVLPALGGVACGLLTRLAPETRGGGADAMIEAFHHRAGVIRRRVIPVKLLASLASLGTGGAGGREGPTMQIGAALGSAVGRLLGVGARERRILLVAGVGAGMAAVFRTPLGAALLAVGKPTPRWLVGKSIWRSRRPRPSPVARWWQAVPPSRLPSSERRSSRNTSPRGSMPRRC